jgi:hypothetical protein
MPLRCQLINEFVKAVALSVQNLHHKCNLGSILNSSRQEA